LPCIAKIPEFEAQHVGQEMVLSVDLLKLFFFDDGVDGITGRAGNSFAEMECFYPRSNLSLQVPVPGCSI
jgi:hypothetical protein